MWYYVCGGERSGKTKYAMQIAEKLSSSPIYLATARIKDNDFKARVTKHITERGEHWQTINCEKYISSQIPSGKTIVIDCVTMWLANFFFDHGEDSNKAIKCIKEQLNALKKINNDLIFVSNELGMGIHPENKISRDFIVAQGTVNQFIAKMSTKAFLMVSGLPLTLKK